VNRRPTRTQQQEVALSGLKWLAGAFLLACFVTVALNLSGCVSARPTFDPSKAFVLFKDGSVGASNDPIRFPAPLVAVRAPFPLKVGEFAIRHDRYLLGDQFILHQIVQALPDGTYVMQGYNRVTNPVPDKFLLTPANYVGLVFPLPETLP
jgi:hypothetical protein